MSVRAYALCYIELAHVIMEAELYHNQRRQAEATEKQEG
jgi:hypothetical protein